jgi:2-polyprenyl-3-methyl-5-hydroxy-6-metoxy-1,4-benzoquinol methylase
MTISEASTPSPPASAEALAAQETASEEELGIQETVARVVDELASAGFVSMIAIGDRLGLYAALDDLGEVEAATLAEATACNERLVLEWLSGNAAVGYVTYDPAHRTFALRPAAAAVLADESAPTFLAPAATVIRSYYTDQDQLEAAFRGRGGIAWGDHHDCMFGGVERFFAAAYRVNLTSTWIPSVPGLAEKLSAGARVADVGCGYGISTAMMAAEYPASEFHGSDFHEPSIARARAGATEQGVAARTRYEVASSVDYGGGPFDVICFFDALHDMGDPAAAIRYARSQLAEDGIVLLVEMYAGEDLATSIGHPLARWFYAASTVLCTPTALAQEGPLALGNQAGPRRWRELFEANGFGRFRVALETPFNLVMEARPRPWRSPASGPSSPSGPTPTTRPTSPVGSWRRPGSEASAWSASRPPPGSTGPTTPPRGRPSDSRGYAAGRCGPPWASSASRITAGSASRTVRWQTSAPRRASSRSSPCSTTCRPTRSSRSGRTG